MVRVNWCFDRFIVVEPASNVDIAAAAAAATVAVADDVDDNDDDNGDFVDGVDNIYIAFVVVLSKFVEPNDMLLAKVDVRPVSKERQQHNWLLFEENSGDLMDWREDISENVICQHFTLEILRCKEGCTPTIASVKSMPRNEYILCVL